MIFTYEGENYNSDLLERWMPPQDKAYVKLLKDRILTLEFQLRESLRTIEDMTIKEK